MSDLRELLGRARAAGASDLHLVAGLPPAIRVQGEIRSLRNEDALTNEATCALTLELLTPAQQQALERERQLCVSIRDGDGGRVRLSAYYHHGIPELTARLCAQRVACRDELGLPAIIDDLAGRPHGLILIAGRTNVGKTTTLNYMVDRINRERRAKVVTIEDPVEYEHRSMHSLIIQQEMLSDVPSFPRALAHALRLNPDVIVVGEMREQETVQTALSAADTGHLVLATLHTTGAAQTVERISGVLPTDAQGQAVLQLAASLQGVIVQELVPRADGKGRVLAYETLLATTAVRSVIRGGEPHKLDNIITTSRREGMVSMDECLRRLYETAVITYDEATSRMRAPGTLLRRASPRRVG